MTGAYGLETEAAAVSFLLQQTPECGLRGRQAGCRGGEAGATGPGCLPPSLGGEHDSGVTVQAHPLSPQDWQPRGALAEVREGVLAEVWGHTHFGALWFQSQRDGTKPQD